MLYINDDIESIDPDRVMDGIPRQRRERLMQLRNARDRRLGLAAYMLLCGALEVEYGITGMPDFGYGDGGKPFIADRPDICFNMSHCRVAAACAVGGSPMGVDIETIRPYNATLARRVLSGVELAAVEASLRPDIEFIRLWTMKESYLKMTGEGIRRDLKTVLPASAVFSTTVNTVRGYVCTVCRGSDGSEQINSKE